MNHCQIEINTLRNLCSFLDNFKWSLKKNTFVLITIFQGIILENSCEIINQRNFLGLQDLHVVSYVYSLKPFKLYLDCIWDPRIHVIKQSLYLVSFCNCFRYIHLQFSSIQISRSVVSDSLQPHESQTPGLPVHHQLPEFTQTHVHRVSDAIQPSRPLSSPSPPAPNPSQHQSLFQ